MPERKPLPAPFEEAAVAAALHTEARPTADLALGPGQRYDLAAGQLSLEIFPERRPSRITTPTSRLELFDSPPPRVVNDQVVFSRESGQEDASLSVSAEGIVIFGYVHSPTAPDQPTTAPERAQELPPAAPAGEVPPTADTSPPATLRPPPDQPPHPIPDTAGTPPPASSGCTADKPTKQQQPRVQLTGRLGRDPSFRTSPRGTLVGRFSLAVHWEDGSTVWHSIVAFGSRAEQLRTRADAGELAKGREVDVVGYPHTRQQPTKTGGTRTVTEIHAAAVIKRS